MTSRLKFVLFSIGMGVGAASSVTSLYLLYLSLLGTRSVVYEPNPMLATIEMAFLVLAAATCVAASEIYYRYLEMKKSLSAKDS